MAIKISGPKCMTLFFVENSKSMNLVLTLYGNHHTRLYSLQNVRSWYILSSHLRFVYYYLQFVAVLSPQYNVLLEVSGTRGFQKWMHNQRHMTTVPRAHVLLFSFNLHVERSPLAFEI